MDRCASVLALRTRARTKAAASSTAGSESGPAASRSSAGSGQGLRWMEPPPASGHHDQTSSVTKGRNGAKSRSRVESARVRARLADAAPSSPAPP